jgi:PAS domain S-box-containing protein
MLRRRIAFSTAVVSLVLSLTLIGAGIWMGRAIVSIMSAQMIRLMNDDVRRDVAETIQAGERMLARVANDIVRHDVPIDSPSALGRELYGLMIDPRYDWLFCGNEAGGAMDVGRLGDGTLVFLMTDGLRAGVMREYEASEDGRIGSLRKSGAEFDTHRRDWYTRAKETHGNYWTEPYPGAAEPILGMTLAAPVVNKNGAFIGVCGLDLILTTLSNFMHTVRLGDNGRAFIIDSTGQLIASSGNVLPVVIGTDGQEKRLDAAEAPDAIVRNTARYINQHAEITRRLPVTSQELFSFDDSALGTIHAAVDRIEMSGGSAWIVVSALPASDFLGPVQRVAYFSATAAALIITAYLVLVTWAAGRALQPMTVLTEAAQAVAKGEWRDVPESGRRDEIGLLAQAFNLMTARLKETLEGLRRSEESYRAIFEGALEGIARTTLDGKMLTANPALARMLGYASAQEMIAGERGFHYVSEDERDDVMSALAGEGAAVRHEAQLYRKDDSRIWVSFSSQVVRDTATGRLCVESLLTDISDRKKAEAALFEARSELAHAARVMTLGELTASIAHEINQPLAAVRTNAETALRWLARSEPNLPKARELTQRVVVDASRAAEIIARIRTMAVQHAPQQAPLSLNELVEDSIAFLRHEFQASGISVSLDLAPQLPPVLGDRVQLQQVMINLAVNAVQAIVSSGAMRRNIRIRTALSDPDFLCCIVEDSGPGIDAAHLPRLFDSFFTTKDTGMGMGLPISRSILEAHGGHIRVDNESSLGGARFSFTLPAKMDS